MIDCTIKDKLNFFFLQSTGVNESINHILKEKCNLYYLKNLDSSANLEIADVIFTELQYTIDGKFISLCPNLKYIITPTTGLNHLDLGVLSQKNIEIVSLKGETEFLSSIPSTGEFTFALILSLFKNIPGAVADVSEGNWERNKFIGHNLKEKTIGLLGFGRVAKQVAHYAHAFGMKVIFYDEIEMQNTSIASSVNNIEELFCLSDLVSLHITGDLKNNNFVDSKLLGKMKKNSLLVNTSRGIVLDETAVAQSLQSGQLRGFAADVLAIEGLGNIKDSIIYKLSKKGYHVIITPHIAGATKESMEMTTNFVINKFLKLI
jgi:D-3-phosphoglycerate dehydrogenase